MQREKKIEKNRKEFMIVMNKQLPALIIYIIYVIFNNY